MSSHETVDKPGETTIEKNDVDAIPEVDVTMDMVMSSGQDPESWLLYGGNHQNHRHSTANVITPDNVDSLSLEYKFNVGQQPGDYQGTPLVVPGDPPIIYQTNGPDHMRAINARTGDILWHWHYESAAPVGDPPSDRGVSIVGDTIYRSTLDLGVMALDRYTGDEKWYFSQTKEYRGETVEGWMHEQTDFVRNVGFASSIPPIPYKDTLFKGSFGGEWGVSGWIDSVNMDGSHNWRFNTTPPDQWVGDAWEHGCATVWQPPAVDPESGTVVFPVGNPGPDFDGSVRPGWNMYSSGKLALDADTGEYEWHYQEAPHDLWDYDSPSPPIIWKGGDDERTYVSWAGKTGWLFTADLETGRLITRSEPYVQHLKMWSMPLKEDFENTPWHAPSAIGGTDPQPAAFDPDRRTMIVKGANVPWKVSWTDSEYKDDELYMALDDWTLASQDDDVEGWNKNEGVIAALDPLTGDLKWRDWRSTAQWGGVMTTSTGLTFAGTAEGDFIAYDTETGEELWSHTLGPGLGGDPVTWYDPGGSKQYVAIQGGGSGTLGGFGEKGDIFAVFSLEGEQSTETESNQGDGLGLGALLGLAGLGAGAVGYAKKRWGESKNEE